MRILLQQKETGLYFENLGLWAPSSKEAMNFPSSAAAIEFCATHHIQGVHLVMKFDDYPYDIVLPVHPVVPPEPPGERPNP